ncbi:type II secretion system F family protein [Candidatus Daviesbacteria bacterium]|nr:type II secretion system F family protein [Candidatus Daviesbacteria bacterium]
MPIFLYTARDLKGVDHKGTIETVDEQHTARILGKRGLIIISIKKKDDQTKKIWDKYLKQVSFSDLVVATRQLATMVESGLVLSESIDILAEQQSNKTLKEVFSEVSRDIKSGMDLASAFKKHPDVFPTIYINLVKSGEKAGKLDVILTQLAETLEKDREFRNKIRGAMIYPALVLGMMAVVVVVMMIFVVPRLTNLYTESSIELPLPTKILIWTSNLFTNFWWLMLVIALLAIFAFRRWVKTSSGRMSFDALLLRLPIIGKIIKGTVLTNFSRTFGLLVTAGIPLLESLTIVATVIGNSIYKKAIEDTYKGVERGLTFSAQLESVGVFPSIIYQMFRVGEETGKVDKVAFKMAEYFESETDQTLKNITVVIEPVILIILGIGVTFLVISIILPIYKLTTSIT